LVGEAVGDFSEEKMASIWVGESWAGASAGKESEVTNTAACHIFKGRASEVRVRRRTMARTVGYAADLILSAMDITPTD